MAIPVFLPRVALAAVGLCVLSVLLCAGCRSDESAQNTSLPVSSLESAPHSGLVLADLQRELDAKGYPRALRAVLSAPGSFVREWHLGGTAILSAITNEGHEYVSGLWLNVSEQGRPRRSLFHRELPVRALHIATGRLLIEVQLGAQAAAPASSFAPVEQVRVGTVVDVALQAFLAAGCAVEKDDAPFVHITLADHTWLLLTPEKGRIQDLILMIRDSASNVAWSTPVIACDPQRRLVELALPNMSVTSAARVTAP